MRLNNLVNEIKITFEKMFSDLGLNHSENVTYSEVQRLSGLDSKTIEGLAKIIIKISTEADVDIDRDWNEAIRIANRELFYRRA